MTIEQKIFSKLEPHAKRIKNGEGNDFDYFPAVLLQVIEGQQLQAKLATDTVISLTSLENKIISVGAQSNAKIIDFEAVIQRKMEQVEIEIRNIQTQLQSLDVALNERIAMFVSAHEVRTIQTNKGLSAIGLQIESFGISTKRHHDKYIKLLISWLAASTTTIVLAIVILHRN